MENPKQVAYTPEELFAFRPETFTTPITISTPAMADPIIGKSGLWKNNKWYIIIGGLSLLTGICLYIHKRNQKKKNSNKQE